MSALLNQALDIVAFLLGLALLFGALAVAADYLERRYGP